MALKVADIPQVGNEEFLKLQSVTEEIISHLEASVSQVPAYHNQQHIADAILSMAYFLGQLPDIDVYKKQLLLLVMAVHDFGHRGISNKLQGLSHEDESILLLKETALRSLHAKDIAFVEECILATKPENIVRVNQEYIANPQDSVALMRALVNDADIAASFINPIGLELSRLILVEQGMGESSEEEIAVALHNFRSRAKISTSVARYALGLENTANL